MGKNMNKYYTIFSDGDIWRDQLKYVLDWDIHNQLLEADNRFINQGYSYHALEQLLDRYNKRKNINELTRSLVLMGTYALRIFLYNPMTNVTLVHNRLANENRQRLLIQSISRMIKRSCDYIVRNQSSALWIDKVTPLWSGTSIKAYDQSFDSRKKDQPNTEKGWCLGMAIVYLGSVKAKKNFWQTMNSYEGGSRVKFLMNQQMVNNRKVWGSDTVGKRSDLIGGPLKKEGLEYYNSIPKTTYRNSDKVYKSIVKYGSKKVSYIYIIIHFQNGGHAMAAYIDSNRVIRFMDPNLGEVEFAGFENFKLWFREFIRYQEYDIKKYEMFYYE